MQTNHTARPTELERTLYTRRRMPCCGCAHWLNVTNGEFGHCKIHQQKTPAGFSCQSWQCSPQLQGVVTYYEALLEG